MNLALLTSRHDHFGIGRLAQLESRFCFLVNKKRWYKTTQSITSLVLKRGIKCYVFSTQFRLLSGVCRTGFTSSVKIIRPSDEFLQTWCKFCIYALLHYTNSQVPVPVTHHYSGCVYRDAVVFIIASFSLWLRLPFIRRPENDKRSRILLILL